MTLTRPSAQRPATRPEQALIMLRAGAGAQWDPELVELLPVALRPAEAPAQPLPSTPLGSLAPGVRRP